MNAISGQLAFEEQLKNMGFDLSNIANIVDLANNDAACGPDCKRQRKLAELRDAMTAAEKDTEDAPQKLAEARKNYFLYKEGEKGYLELQLDDKRKEAINKINSLKTEFDKRVQRTQTLVDEYEAMWTYRENTSDLFETHNTKNRNLTKDIDDTKSKVFTNDRRFYYYDQAIGWQWYINKLAEIGYWIIAVTYVVYYLFYKGNYTNRRSLAYGGGILILPFVVTYIFTFSVSGGYSIQSFLDRIVNAVIGYV